MDNTSRESGDYNGLMFAETELASARETRSVSAPRQDQRRRHDFLRVFGVMVVGLGVVLTAVGSISLFASWGSVGGSRYYWAAFLGLPLVAVGSAFSQAENLTGYEVSLAGDITPVATEMGRSYEAVVACARCQATNPPAAKFCNQCGTSLMAPTCGGCGARLTWNARFCTRCGKALV